MNGESIWDILDIAPTTDTRVIKRAYAKVLKVCRPEEDAERFQRLRWAYEWALHHAAEQAPPEPDQPPAPRLEPPTVSVPVADSRDRQITARYAEAAQQQQLWRRERQQQEAKAKALANHLLQTPAASAIALQKKIDEDLTALGNSFDSNECYELALLRTMATMPDLPWSLLHPVAEKFSWFDKDVQRQLLRLDREAATQVLRPMLAEHQFQQWQQSMANDALGKQLLAMLNKPALGFSDKALRLRSDVRQRLPDLMHMLQNDAPELWWRLQQNASTQWWLALLERRYQHPIARFHRWCAARDFYPINWREWGIAAFVGLLSMFFLKAEHLVSDGWHVVAGLAAFAGVAVLALALNFTDAMIRGQKKNWSMMLAISGAAMWLLLTLFPWAETRFWLLLPLAWLFYFGTMSAGGYWANHGNLLANSLWQQMLLLIWSLIWATNWAHAQANIPETGTIFSLFVIVWPMVAGSFWLLFALHLDRQRNPALLPGIWPRWLVAVCAITLAAPWLTTWMQSSLAAVALLLFLSGWSAYSQENRSTGHTVMLVVLALIIAPALGKVFSSLPAMSQFVMLSMVVMAAMRMVLMAQEIWRKRKIASASS